MYNPPIQSNIINALLSFLIFGIPALTAFLLNAYIHQIGISILHYFIWFFAFVAFVMFIDNRNKEADDTTENLLFLVPTRLVVVSHYDQMAGLFSHHFFYKTTIWS